MHGREKIDRAYLHYIILLNLPRKQRGFFFNNCLEFLRILKGFHADITESEHVRKKMKSS